MERFPETRTTNHFKESCEEGDRSPESILWRTNKTEINTSPSSDARDAHIIKLARNPEDAAAFADFAGIDRKFDALPETAEANRYSANDIVRFPKKPQSNEIVDWKIVRAEKQHYFLEKIDEANDGPGYVMCSEDELDELNRK